MDAQEQRKLVLAAERCAEALQRLAIAVEKGFADKLGPDSPLGQALAKLAAAAPAANETPGEIDGARAESLFELARTMTMRLQEQFALKTTVVVEVSEEKWPALLAAIQAMPEWRYSSAVSNRACEVEIGGIVFRADLSELYRR